MEKKPFIAQTSMVPVLACIAALLFSANFYQFLKKNFKQWWGWDFTCPVEQVDCHRLEVKHEHRRHRTHRRHRHDRSHRHDVQERSTIILELDGGQVRVQRELENAERKLQRNLDRARRDLDRLHERMERDATDANRERLETEIRIKADNLRAMEHARRQLESHAAPRDHQDGTLQEFHFDSNDNNVEVRIRKHQ